MATFAPVPYFPTPPQAYDQRYFDQVVRAFSVFAQQMTNPGAERATSLTLTTATGNVNYGELSWNPADETVDLTMGHDVTQQVGFETYMRCKNTTGATIPNGTVVGFSGVSVEIEAAPYLADGSFPNLYFIGITTTEIPDGSTRPATIYGKVRGLDTTGTPAGETWSVGDILYVSASTAGAMTNVRPAAPDEVIVVAAVLAVSATDGEIMVRPTVPIKMLYGRFSSTADQTAASANTAYPVSYTTTDASSGVSVSSGSQLTVAQSGYYNASISVQVTSTNSSAATFYLWLAKNGTAVPNTTRAFTIKANGDTKVVTVNHEVSLSASDYIEFVWATSSTNVFLDATSGLAFAPDIPSVLVSVTQSQL